MLHFVRCSRPGAFGRHLGECKDSMAAVQRVMEVFVQKRRRWTKSLIAWREMYCGGVGTDEEEDELVDDDEDGVGSEKKKIAGTENDVNQGGYDAEIRYDLLNQLLLYS